MSARVVDLSLPLGAELPCQWPGLPPFAARATTVIGPETGPGFSRSLTVEEHMGTHMDAPLHVADESGTRPIAETSVLDVPLEHLLGRLRMLDARTVRGETPGESPWVGIEALERLEEEEAVIGGDIVALWTGWTDEHYRPGNDAYISGPVAGTHPGWPAPAPELVLELAARGVRAIGVDTPTLGAVHDALSPHRAALGNEITPIEGLTNLAAVADLEATFVFLPLPVQGAGGAPGRAIALLS